MRKSRKRNPDMIASMFLSVAAAMILTQLAEVIANIVDGVVTSHFLGPEAYSAVSLLGPMTTIFILFTSFITIGGQILCAQKVGAGEKEEAGAIFSFTLLFGVFLSVFFVTFCTAAPHILFGLFGINRAERPELYTHMSAYLKGYIPGIPALIMVQILGPFLVIDNGKRLVSLSSVILCVSDVAGDLINVFLLHGGVYMMGITTSVSLWMQLLFLLNHFAGRSGYFRFSLKALSPVHLAEIAKSGSLSFVRKLASILRDIIINRINLGISVSLAAVAARGVQRDLNLLVFCLGFGLGKALLSMAAMYYGAKDGESLKRVFSCAMKYCVILGGICGAAVFAAAPLIAGFYTRDPEVLSLSVFSIRCMALGLIPDAVAVAYQDYLQGIRHLKMVNFLCFAERFFIPVLTAWVLGVIFGPRGIMASIAVGKLVLILMVFVILILRNGKIPRKWGEYMLLPDSFGGSGKENIYVQIRSMDNVIQESERAMQFCLDHGIDRRRSYLMGLFVEEMAGNIVLHGKSGKRDVFVDYRLFADNGRICLTLRDYCERFDPVHFAGIHEDDRPEANLGIRMVLKLADDIRYIHSFNSNCLLIYMAREAERQEAEKR